MCAIISDGSGEAAAEPTGLVKPDGRRGAQRTARPTTVGSSPFQLTAGKKRTPHKSDAPSQAQGV